MTEGPSVPEQPSKALVRRTIAAAALSTVLVSLPVWMLGGLATLARADLGFSLRDLGLAVSVYFVFSALGALPAGRVAHRWGARGSTMVAAGGSGVALIGMALAPSYSVLVCMLALGGLCNALGQMGSNAGLARVVPRHRQGFAFGIKQSAVPATTLLAGFSLPIVGLTLGWRPGVALAAVLVLPYFLLAPPSGRAPVKRVAARRAYDVSLKGLLLVSLASALASGATNALGAFLVESAISSGITPARAGILLAGGSALGVVARLIAGWRADFRQGRHLLTVAFMLLGGALGVFMLAVDSVFALVLGTVFAFGLGWSWPGLLNFGVVRVNPSAPAVATSITQMGAFAGGAVGPLAFGATVEATSYDVAWVAAAVAMLAAAVLLIVARRVLARDLGSAQPGPTDEQ